MLRIIVCLLVSLGFGSTMPCFCQISTKVNIEGELNVGAINSNDIRLIHFSGGRSDNVDPFDMFKIGGISGGQGFLDLNISFGHSGGGSHIGYRRSVMALNAFEDIILLEDNVYNHNGPMGYTYSRPHTDTLLISWDGAGAVFTFALFGSAKSNKPITISNVGMTTLKAE